jgi:hypothetical protein
MEQKLEEATCCPQRLIVLDTKDILEILDHVEKLDPLDRMGAMDKILQYVQLEVDPLVYAKYEKITEQRRESVKKWQKKNKEQVRVWQKKYAQKEKEKFVQYSKNYQLENKDKYNEYQKSYRLRLQAWNQLSKVFKQLPFHDEF